LTPAIAFGVDIRRRDIDYDLLRRLIGEWRQFSGNYYGDFYPLTRYSTEDDVWCAWQFNRPEVGEGMVQVFRRPQSSYDLARFKLKGLEAAGRYRVTSLDVTGSTEVTGADLMDKGLTVSLVSAPQSAIIVYKLVK
jgi:alpha-galactosidase